MDKQCSNSEKEIKVNDEKGLNCEKSIENNKPINGLAIAGFVISLLSVICCGIPAFISLGLSIGGLYQAKKSDGSSKGLAIAGIVISSIMILFIVCFWAICFVVGIFEEIYTPGMGIMY